MATNQVTLGYWAIRGLAEPLRTLLEYLDTPYNEEKYEKLEEWIPKKSSKFTRFPNLPYLVDGDKIITESEAIAAHIILKSNKSELLGKSEDIVNYAQLKGNICDFQNGISEHIYGCKDHEELKKKVEEYMKEQGRFKLEGLSETLGEKDWLLGDITWLDFHLAELIERFAQLDEEVGTKITTNYPNLVAHYKRFLEIPAVKTYRQSERFHARPHNYYEACWL